MSQTDIGKFPVLENDKIMFRTECLQFFYDIKSKILENVYVGLR